VRGNGGTPTPAVHSSGSTVESLDKSLKITAAADTQTTTYKFNKSKPNFATTFVVDETLDTVKNQFALYIGPNQLMMDTGNSLLGKTKFGTGNTPNDYRLSLDAAGHVIVTFTQSAIDRITNGVSIKAVYTRYAQFQEGMLADSMSSISIFLKNNPYY
jgi:hypothetical protein